MRHLIRRAAAGATACLILGFGVVPARAQETPPILSPRDCHAFPVDPNASVPQAWHLDRLGMDQAWRIATGRGVEIAVVDTGVALVGSPYLPPERFTTYDLLGGMSNKDLEQGGIDCLHGTQVVGLLAGGRSGTRPLDDRTNFSGIAPDATVISYRALAASVGGQQEPEEDRPDDVQATIAAIRHATEIDVDIINLSLVVPGGDPGLPELQAAVTDALDAGIVVVAAAGNVVEGMSGPAYPASFDGVISVGMTTRTDAPSQNSWPAPEGAPAVTIGAPGSDLMSIRPSSAIDEATASNQSYAAELEGTSFAAPLVSGVIALMLEENPDLTPGEVRQRLIDTADPPSNTAPGRQLGWGIVNPLRAIAGVAVPPETESSEVERAPAPPLPEPEQRDMTPVYAGIGIGAGALLLAGAGLVVAITIPAARRRNAGDVKSP